MDARGKKISQNSRDWVLESAEIAEIGEWRGLSIMCRDSGLLWFFRMVCYQVRLVPGAASYELDNDIATSRGLESRFTFRPREPQGGRTWT